MRTIKNDHKLLDKILLMDNPGAKPTNNPSPDLLTYTEMRNK